MNRCLRQQTFLTINPLQLSRTWRPKSSIKLLIKNRSKILNPMRPFQKISQRKTFLTKQTPNKLMIIDRASLCSTTVLKRTNTCPAISFQSSANSISGQEILKGLSLWWTRKKINRKIKAYQKKNFQRRTLSDHTEEPWRLFLVGTHSLRTAEIWLSRMASTQETASK